jgi:hypothetical protein
VAFDDGGPSGRQLSARVCRFVRGLMNFLVAPRVSQCSLPQVSVTKSFIMNRAAFRYRVYFVGRLRI